MTNLAWELDLGLAYEDETPVPDGGLAPLAEPPADDKCFDAIEH